MDSTGYITLTRQSGLMREMQVVANNIANAATTGFRQEGVVFSEYVRKKRLPLDKIGDRKEFIRGIDQREEIYRSNDGHLLYEVVLMTSKSLRADAQAVLTTRPNR